jgi:hypothetical protein
MVFRTAGFLSFSPHFHTRGAEVIARQIIYSMMIMFGAVNLANASLITFAYEGVITQTASPGVLVGDSFYGSYTFDSLASGGSTGSITNYRISGPDVNMTLNYGSYSFQSHDYSILVIDGSCCVDIYRAQMEIDGVLYALSFITSNPNIITNSELLLSPPDISLFGQAQMSVNDNSISIPLQTRGNIASISAAPVPEPETYAMMLAGLGLLGFMARRRKQKEERSLIRASRLTTVTITHKFANCISGAATLMLSIVGFYLVPSAFAAEVPEAGVIAVTGTTLTADPTLAGPILYDVITPFTMSLADGGTITGSFQDRVVRDTLGTLDFYSRITNDSTSTEGVDLFSRGNEANFSGSANLEYMDYRTDGLGSVAPLDAMRSVASSTVGFYFDFGNGILPGQDSYFMFYRSNATAFEVVDTGGVVANYDSTRGIYNNSNYFAVAVPIDAVPEPETYAMLIAGLGLLGFMARRRKQKAA